MSNAVWISKESWDRVCGAINNIQIRCDESILTPSARVTGTGSSAAIIISIPHIALGQNGYMGYFKIVDRSHTIEQDRDVSYDKRLYKIAVCDGSSYIESIPRSNPSCFYLNEDGIYEYNFPYTESETFTGTIWEKYVYIEARIKWDIGEEGEEKEEGEEEKFIPEYKVLVSSEGKATYNAYDYKTGLLTCRYRIGHIRFPEYISEKSGPLAINQEHLAGPIRMFWYLSWQDLERLEEAET